MNTTQPKPAGAGAKKASFNLKALAHEMERTARLEAGVLEQEPDQDFLAQARLTGLGLFRVVVMGEIKKGKSSFINALLGTKDLVPVHSDVATSTIFKIHYGPELKYTVYFEKHTKKEKLEIDAAKLTDYGTETGNPNNEKQVDFIRVESPAPLLRNGLIVVDTPGVGGLFKEHREITFRHAPNADAVFFVTESITAPIGADEVKFLKELRQITKLITFVQTKSSKADGEARKARMANNLSILEDQVGLEKEEISYFIVDSVLKIEADGSHDREDLEDSGFLPLMTYINNTLRKNQEVHVARVALTKTKAKILSIAGALHQRQQVLEADTDEKRKALDQQLVDLQRHLIEWERDAKPRILDDLRSGLSRLTREAQGKLDPLKPGGEIQVEFERLIEKAPNVETVQALMSGIESDLAAATSKVCLQVAGHAKAGTEKLLQELQSDIATSFSEGYSLQLSKSDYENLRVNTSAIGRVVGRDMSDGFFEDARSGLYGGMAGAGIAMVIGGVLGSVVPVIGTIAGSWVGVTLAGLWGCHENRKKNYKQKLDALKRESYVALQQAITSASQAASSQINNLMSEIQIEATSYFSRMISRSSEDLAKRRQELAETQKVTQKEIVERKRKHKDLSSELDRVTQTLKDFQATIPC
jgi:hypothetical protein